MQFADPDIAKADQIAVVLKRQRQLAFVSLVLGFADEYGRATQRDVVVDQHAVVQDGHGCRLPQLPVGRKARRGEHDVVALPLARCPGRIDRRDVLLVDAARLTIRIGDAFVGVEHLHLVSAH